ncbi:beta-microseminoprotein-like [Littorina saxatilis]|uniref:beta-microseminoprotein-like n=1 Tax=Littorina saxatilis TaxID=31220 RepID=UPI0038B55444
MDSSVMAVVKFVTSMVLASLILTSLGECACFRKSLSFDQSPGLAEDQTGLSVFCLYGDERKQLFTAWVDLQACTRCFCSPSGLNCCSLGTMAGAKGCQARV